MASEANPIQGLPLPGEMGLFPLQVSGKILPLPQRKAVDALNEFPSFDASDEELVGLVQQGNSSALEMLFNRHSRLVYRIALRMLKDVGEAEEVVQECFLYIYRRSLLYKPERGTFKVWLVQIAYSRARDRKDYLKRRGFYGRMELDDAVVQSSRVLQSDIEKEANARLDVSRLRGAFAQLNEIQRKTLTMFYFDGMDLRDISVSLAVPLGNVRHHYYRGLERLRKSAFEKTQRTNGNG